MIAIFLSSDASIKLLLGALIDQSSRQYTQKIVQNGLALECSKLKHMCILCFIALTNRYLNVHLFNICISLELHS